MIEIAAASPRRPCIFLIIRMLHTQLYGAHTSISCQPHISVLILTAQRWIFCHFRPLSINDLASPLARLPTTPYPRWTFHLQSFFLAFCYHQRHRNFAPQHLPSCAPPQTANMPQNEYMERWRKLHGRRSVFSLHHTPRLHSHRQ